MSVLIKACRLLCSLVGSNWTNKCKCLPFAPGLRKLPRTCKTKTKARKEASWLLTEKVTFFVHLYNLFLNALPLSNSFLLSDIYTMDYNRIILLWVIIHGWITFLMGLSGLLDFPPRTRDKSWLWVTVWTAISLGVLLRWLWSSDQVGWLCSRVASHPGDGTGRWPRLTAMVSIECHTLWKVYTIQNHFQLPWSKICGKAPIWMCPIMQIKYPHTHLPWKRPRCYVCLHLCALSKPHQYDQQKKVLRWSSALVMLVCKVVWYGLGG